MSTLVSEILAQSFREANFVAVGASPTVAELAEALPRLNTFIGSLFGNELGELFYDWYVPSLTNPPSPLRVPLVPGGASEPTVSWKYPPQNVRIVTKLTTVDTLYFPAFPSDGARMFYVNVGATATLTLSGNGRLIEGAATLTDTPSNLHSRSWFYRADLGNWIRLKTLISSDEVPLPVEFDDLLIKGMAIRMAPRYGVKDIDQVILVGYADMLSRLKKRYKQAVAMPYTSGDLSEPLTMDITTGI